MKVRVDQELCDGDEICIQVCPDIFEMEKDKAKAKMSEVPKELESCCREAADSCPVEAIIIEE